ncbi:MAG TPA: GNAT family N-acetyltransferase [Actinomycetota bacterium]|nr:GNAT family N-acetyltransferase [Actinomycetota bacterium]
MGFRIKSARERPDLAGYLLELDRLWPAFYLGNPYRVSELSSMYPTLQMIVIDEDNDVIAGVRSIPIRWDGSEDSLPAGWDAAMEQARVKDPEANTLCAISIIVRPDKRRGGVSKMALYGVQRAALDQGFTQLVAPVRPSMKERYPLTPIDQYLEWRGDNGERFDPWVRVHEETGARIARVAPKSIEVTGTIKEWESWTGLTFPESGDYVVEGALEPVRIDVTKGIGVYEEPNIWMIHDLRTGAQK